VKQFGPDVVVEVAGQLKKYALHAENVLDLIFWNGVELLTISRRTTTHPSG
jgi:hypothetical protein